MSRDGILQSPSWLISGVVEGPQGLGVGGLVPVPVWWFLPRASLWNSPQPVDRPILTTSNQDGSFRLEIVQVETCCRSCPILCMVYGSLHARDNRQSVAHRLRSRWICATRDPMRRRSSSSAGMRQTLAILRCESHAFTAMARVANRQKARSWLFGQLVDSGTPAALGKSSDSGSSILFCAPWEKPRQTREASSHSLHIRGRFRWFRPMSP